MTQITEKELITKLNWFYSLENEQVKLYLSQADAADDQYVKLVLKKVAEIEEGHVKNIRELIYNLGGEPTHIGGKIGVWIAEVFGQVSAVTGPARMFHINTLLENRAINDYIKLLKLNPPDAVTQVLWNNIVDEDLHCAWFKARATGLQQDREVQFDNPE